MNLRYLAVAMVCLLQFAGCASGVKRSEAPQQREAYFSGQGKVAGDLSMSLSKEAQAQLPENLKFDSDRFLATIRRALDAKGMLARQPDKALPKIEVIVTEIRVRSNFSAVMWGFLAGSDSLAGQVIVRDTSGNELQRFSVSASYALGGLAGGQDDTRMGWLYETFAKHTIEELTGSAGTRQ